MTPILRKYQSDLVERVRYRYRDGVRRVVVQAPVGAGKCLGEGTPVLLYDGTVKPVEDVMVGHMLMGPDSLPRRILSVCSGEEMLYRVTPVKGDHYVINESHILSLKMTPLISGDQHTVHAIDVPTFLTLPQWKRDNLKGWRTGVDFPARDIPLDPYFLGIWLADGTVGMPIVSKPDQEIDDYLAQFADVEGVNLVRKIQPGKCPSLALVGRTRRSNHVTAKLRNLGVCNDKHVPALYRVNSREVRLAVLAGILDGDGHCDHGGFDFISKYKRLADDVVFLCRSLGLAAYLAPCRKSCQGGFTGDYFRVSISGDCSIIPNKIERKKAAPRLQQKNVLVTGITVEPIGIGRYFGFSIDGDRLFLLGDFTVTHNTLITSEMVRCAVAKGRRVLFLAHRRRLITQKSKKLVEFGVPHGVLMSSVSANLTLPVQVASRDTILSRAVRNDWIALPPADLVIVDEAHRVPGDEYTRLLEMYPNAYHLGTTATPARDDGKGLGDFYQAIECCVPISRLIAEGYLCPVTCYAPQNYGKRHVSKRKLAGDPISTWKAIANGRPTILFAGTVAASVAACQAFNDAGVPAEHMDAHTDDDERDRIIARVESGETVILANCGVFIEGVDVPCLSCIILLRMAGSYILFIQAVGRTMRAYPGKSEAILIDHADAVLEHGFPDEDVRWTLDTSDTVECRNKKDRKDGKHKNPIACPQCGYLYSGTIVCPQCAYKLPKKLQPTAVKNQLLTEVEKTLTEEQKRETRIRYWRSCLAIMARKDRTMGAASQMYRQRYKEWPPDDFPHAPTKSDCWRKVAEVYPQYLERSRTE